MKTHKKKIIKKSKVRKEVSMTKMKPKTKKVVAAKVKESSIHNTSGDEMPDPYARNRPLRKDVRFAFRR